jgi:hypothetical protein
MPVPADAPAPPAQHPRLGAATLSWEYRDGAQRLLGVVCRFDAKPDKEIRSLVFAEHEKWGRQWRWLGFPKPRPLYGLDRLVARPDAPVVVTEGEKAADAAGELAPDYVAITSPGGSKAASAADWSMLAGREVTIWPDADEPGREYARQVAEILAKLSPLPSIAIANPPSSIPEGGDAADALAMGWTPAQVAALIAKAVPASNDDPEAGAKRPKTRDFLMSLLGEVELWHDPERIAYATMSTVDHLENHQVGSDGFKNWLAWRAYEANGAVPAAEMVEAMLRVAKALALNRGPCCKTWRRVAQHDGLIFLDLGCQRWRAVEISASGWRIVDAPPVKFLRSRGMLALPEPQAGEKIEVLREFVNVESDGDFRLFVAFVTKALHPSGPFPILVVTGPAGSSKSTLAKIVVLLVDPQTAPSSGPPREERDLFISASNSWLLAYTNLSTLPQWFSDALCRLADGEGFKIRQLNTDRDEIIFSGARPILLNGIGNLARQPDLADRSLQMTPPPIPDNQRREESEFWTAFEAARPLILGAICDIVAGGLRRIAEVKLERRPRRADFARWGAACAPGWGSDPAEFIADYEDNRSDAMVAAAEASHLLPPIEAVLAGAGLDDAGFEGTATELLKA